ncbi:pectinesterase [Carex littledalei]|uniref:Pectinesterase n=1 Tax=Carex littledalei TaxID=544730 RepID=A0A833QM53_9POAL|nr:pectinesterase [Carex littledalei]
MAPYEISLRMLQGIIQGKKKLADRLIYENGTFEGPKETNFLCSFFIFLLGCSLSGRPWKKYSRTVFMKSDMDGMISKEGWSRWDGTFALDTLYYAEYMNTGDGARTNHRVRWRVFM